MKVAFDDQIFVRQRKGGITRVFSELLRVFGQRQDLGVQVELEFVFTRSDLPMSGRLPLRIPAGTLLDRRAVAGGLNRLLSRPRRSSDLLHVTYYDRASLRRAAGRLVVSSVHDMIPELHPELVGQRVHGDKLEVLRSSDLVLCGSRTARADLEAVCGRLDAMVRVCPYGTRLLPQSPVASGRRRNLLLYVGPRNGYKSFATLLDALSLVPRSIPVEVVCVGGGAFDGDEAVVGAGHLVRHVEADDKLLATLYSVASVLVSTSLAEGFGLPVLEAMAAGCPVLISDIPVYREIAATAAAYFAPGDESDLAARLVELLEDDDLRRSRSTTGRERASVQTWEACAAGTANAYRELLG